MDLNSWHLFHLTKGPFTKGGQFFGAPLPPKKLENFDIPKDKNIRIEEGGGRKNPVFCGRPLWMTH